MVSVGSLGSPTVFGVSLALSLVVLAYRVPALSRVRRGVDRLGHWVSGDDDWKWLTLGRLLIPLVLVTAANIAWNVATVRCSDDSLAILASGAAALHGHDPFLVSFCGAAAPDQIPYGLSEVGLNALGAVAGSVLGVWLVWQLLALAVVPLAWATAGEDRRYTAVLVATSVLYLPNIATNIGVENAVVPVAVLTLLWANRWRGGQRTALQGIAAFLSTARFPAVFPLLGAPADPGRRRWGQPALVVGVFLGSAAVSYLLWGWSAIQAVYLDEFSRVPGESLNAVAWLIRSGWLHPSSEVAAVQGGGVLALVLWVRVRGYSPFASSTLPIVGVLAFSQYLTFHFVLWLVPVLFLGAGPRLAALAYGALAYFDETYTLWYFGQVKGVWWPYELAGVLLTLLLAAMAALIVREEERRRKIAANSPIRPENPTALFEGRSAPAPPR